VFRAEDPVDLARQAVFLQEVARPDLQFAFTADEAARGRILCDRHQFGQAMTNVLKNAVEAVEARGRTAGEGYAGRIAVSMVGEGVQGREGEGAIAITICDNGIGLPQDRERITEPYMTTREKGTGLGLAIVKKIVEEHGGEMVFAAAEDGGTRVTLRFARDPIAGERTPEAAE